MRVVTQIDKCRVRDHPVDSDQLCFKYSLLIQIQRLAEERSSRWKDYVESSSVDSISAIYLPQVKTYLFIS